MDIPPIILVVMALTGLITYKGIQDASFFNKYSFDMYYIKKGDYLRYFSSGFLHVDWGHFFFNMLTLYFFGSSVVAAVGNLYFIILYIACMLIGNVLTYQLYNKDNNYRAVGASGAIMGLLYAFVIMFPTQTIYLFFIPIPGFAFAIGYLLYSLYGMNKRNDSIGHAAHFGGAIGGMILILIKYPILIQERMLLICVLLLPIFALAFLAKKGKV